jgi:hypothetical protein
VQLTAELQLILREGNGGWEIMIAGNGHCLMLAILEGLGLVGRTPLDLRRVIGAWLLLNPLEELPGGMTVEGTIRAEQGMTVAAYVDRLLDPQAEPHDDDPSTGRRNFPQGTLLEIHVAAR